MNCSNVGFKDKESYNRLLRFNLNRSNIKKVIMTKPYNATSRTLAKYLKETLIIDRLDECESGKKFYWYKSREDSKDYVNSYDIDLLIKSLDNMIYVEYPRLKDLISYLNDVAKLHNMLNIPIVWNLPTGLIVQQRYMMEHKKRIKPIWSSVRSLTLTITDKVKIDKMKQKRALMPNLVHSLDATTLSLLYNSFSVSIGAQGINKVNFYSVHDCYGVTAPNVESLIELLRSIYVQIYADQRYIETFDKDVISNIIRIYGKDNCSIDNDKRILYINKQEYKLPRYPDCNNIDISFNKLKRSRLVK